MAVGLLGHEVSDLCLGKPALRSLPITATLSDAVSALKRSGETCLSVWSCDHSYECECECECVGKISFFDVICFLCKDENLNRVSSLFQSPISLVLDKDNSNVVRHVEPHSSLFEAIDFMLEGTQNLVVPIESRMSKSSKKTLAKSTSFVSTFHKGREYCWITQEDVVRFLLNSISAFAPVASLSIELLGIIDTDILAIPYYQPAYAAVEAISLSNKHQTSVAIVDEQGCLIGEISPYTLASCDETVAAAMATLSAEDLMAYIECGGSPDELVHLVKTRLQEKNLVAMLNLMEELSLSFSPSSSSCSSSDDEEMSVIRHGKSASYSARMVRKSEAIVCHPRSSLVAVMIQALAHRVSYVWVVEDDCTLTGIVTYSGMLKVFREHCRSSA
ncbi:CBS domain [Dillenia turbinata]|uniref:CBS domain n=1 Tax=Dillenia turbinata TaxID=194707 RepID=A0AAN8VN51_9MAGN